MAKILIVEDDLAFGTMIQTWLRKKGFEVERATSVKAALHQKTRLLHSFHRHDQLCRSSECCSRHEIGRD